MTCYSFGGVTPVVDPAAFVHPQASLIGDVVVASGCYIGPQASLRGDFGRITVEAGSNVQDCCVVHCFPGRETVLASRSHVGHGAVLHGASIGHDVLIGMNAVVMDGASIGEYSLVAAGAVVAAETQVPPRSLVVGNPARIARELSDAEIAWKANGVAVYQRLSVASIGGLVEVEPLAAMDEDRPALPFSGDDAIPLREYRRAR